MKPLAISSQHSVVKAGASFYMVRSFEIQVSIATTPLKPKEGLNGAPDIHL